ncbi:universal stress protein [uncultured Roseovarius sp.]|uniref:universal stress protein n=1 Tax=uncultured Roseovarius sp. TaxID=293344 RepID=UPI00262CC759|nr:universal stress protein [uncultured Roseovarius sp.]
MTRNVIAAVDPYDKDSWPMVSMALAPYAHSGSTIHLIHVVPESSSLGQFSQFVPAGFAESHRHEAKDLLEEMARQIGPDVTLKMHQQSGHVHVEVLDLAQEIKADLIVVGAYSEALKDYLLGPKAARIARHAECSVLIARP